MDDVQKSNEEPIKIEIDPASAVALKLQEFDKKIAEAEASAANAEASAANLKMQRAVFLYDSNLQIIVNKHNAQQQS